MNDLVGKGAEPAEIVTRLDKLVARISPKWAVARVQSRLALRAYEGAQKGRRTRGWKTSESGPVTEVRAGRVMLRQRSRDLVRNNPWASRAIAVKVANQIGTGILPRADTGNEDLNRRIDQLHARWAQDCAPECGGTLYGMQALAACGRAESGEVLILMDRGSVRPGRVPLTLQVLEPDWIADDMMPGVGNADGWLDGIQFDAEGRRIAYRLWKSNPSESLVRMRRDTRDVPASDVIHLFKRTRPGQIRGVPDAASVMTLHRDLDDYFVAALMLAKVQSVLGAFVTQNGGGVAGPLGRADADGAGNKLEELAPGIIAYLNPGEDVKFLAPQGSGPFRDYSRIMLHEAAVGWGVTYHSLTGDLADANYSSLRAGSLDVRRQTEQDQHLMYVPMLCQPIWNAFVSQAVVAGLLPREAEGAPARFGPPRFEMIDPNRDTEAMKSAIRAGLITWPDAVSEMGYDPDTQIRDIKATNEKLTEAGIVLDIDPRLVTGTGQGVNSPAVSSTVLSASGD